MNERIKELRKQAAREVSNANQWTNDDEWNELFMERFAELIVKECMRLVEDEYKPVLEDKEMMKDTHWDGYVQCGVDSYVAIREHFFGVEE
jgi:hypothetical protein